MSIQNSLLGSTSATEQKAEYIFYACTNEHCGKKIKVKLTIFKFRCPNCQTIYERERPAQRVQKVLPQGPHLTNFTRQFYEDFTLYVSSSLREPFAKEWKFDTCDGQTCNAKPGQSGHLPCSQRAVSGKGCNWDFLCFTCEKTVDYMTPNASTIRGVALCEKDFNSVHLHPEKRDHCYLSRATFRKIRETFKSISPEEVGETAFLDQLIQIKKSVAKGEEVEAFATLFSATTQLLMSEDPKNAQSILAINKLETTSMNSYLNGVSKSAKKGQTVRIDLKDACFSIAQSLKRARHATVGIEDDDDEEDRKLLELTPEQRKKKKHQTMLDLIAQNVALSNGADSEGVLARCKRIPQLFSSWMTAHALFVNSIGTISNLFGTSISTYFMFLRYAYYINFALGLLVICFLWLPTVILEPLHPTCLSGLGSDEHVKMYGTCVLCLPDTCPTLNRTDNTEFLQSAALCIPNITTQSCGVCFNATSTDYIDNKTSVSLSSSLDFVTVGSFTNTYFCETANTIFWPCMYDNSTASCVAQDSLYGETQYDYTGLITAHSPGMNHSVMFYGGFSPLYSSSDYTQYYNMMIAYVVVTGIGFFVSIMFALGDINGKDNLAKEDKSFTLCSILFTNFQFDVTDAHRHENIITANETSIKNHLRDLDSRAAIDQAQSIAKSKKLNRTFVTKYIDRKNFFSSPQFIALCANYRYCISIGCF